MNRKSISFFCDRCGVILSTANLCPECKRILCHVHFFGGARGPMRRRDGLCTECAARRYGNEQAKQA